MTSIRPFGSSIEVASSKIITEGSKAVTPAIATRCFCPPESRAGSFVLKSLIFTISRTRVTRSSISSRGNPIFSNPKAISSSTVVPTNWLSGFWNTIPTARLASYTVSSFKRTPLMKTSPLPASIRPFMIFASVDFPEPLWPIIANHSPRLTFKETPARASLASSS